MAAEADNNIRSLLVVAALVVALVGWSLWRHRPASRAPWVGWVVSVLVVAGFGAWCLVDAASMEPAAHYVAAGGLFCCLLVVVLTNAWHATRTPIRRLYLVLSVVMVLAIVLQVVHLLVPTMRWSLLATESMLVVAFAIFWVVQTGELWSSGVRVHQRHPHPARERITPRR